MGSRHLGGCNWDNAHLARCRIAGIAIVFLVVGRTCDVRRATCADDITTFDLRPSHVALSHVGSARRMSPVACPKPPFPHRACGRCVFGSAWLGTLPLLCLGCAHGARTARLLCARPMAKQLLCHSWQGRGASGSVTSKASSGRAALPRDRMGSRHLGGCNWDNAHLARCRCAGSAIVAPPFAYRDPMWQGRPRPCGKAEAAHRMLHQWPRSSAALPRPPHAPRHWHSNGFAFGMCAAVLQCAPRARTNGSQMPRTRQSASKNAPATGADREMHSVSRMPFPHQRLAKASHKAKRFQKRFGPAKGLAKGPAYRQKLFSTFFKNPLAHSSKM